GRAKARLINIINIIREEKQVKQYAWSRGSTTTGPSCDWIPPLLKSSRDGTPYWNKGGDLLSFKGNKGWAVARLVSNRVLQKPWSGPP
ncbi:hypothetical protein HAX54_033992, partial [Datura stramonium]|nr:hypothetical protein [Datura stramonium]